MKKRIAARLLTLTMLFGMAAMTSCGQATAQVNFVVPEGGYDGSAVTIYFDHTMGSNLRDVLDLYKIGRAHV